MANAILKTLVTASAVHYLSPKVVLGRSHFPATDPFADRLSKPLRDPWPRLGDSISSPCRGRGGTRCNSLAHLVGRGAHDLFDREKLRWRDELIVSRGQGEILDDVNPRGKDQARSRDDTVIGPEHRSSQPPDAFYEVDFRVQVKTLMDARVLSATAMQTL